MNSLDDLKHNITEQKVANDKVCDYTTPQLSLRWIKPLGYQ